MKKITRMNGEKIVRNVLITLTFISLIINALEFTNMIYINNYDTLKLNNLLVSIPFDIILWLDNIFIYIFGVWYAIIGIKSKKEVGLKVSFSVLSILTTIVVATLIINIVAELFGIF